ncbi:HPF/RaiA family ribosome-associated protein [Flavobacterium crassostreae]|uniref:Ribosomal subunit interface protein n=1 Tax=Flavobacterium crassostreae TaxID=1763534 RepID=A0A1B9DXC9_9FLAO|nr:HPF/RaiA family ribosome-associated protein [Flavobacterium crassostreae]OCB74344.1 ribosomal subunit interface protein [Flavobacterium crassostreae]
MKIQFNTDNNIEGHQRVEAYFASELETALARFEDKITRVEVHVGDENSAKPGVNDKRCLIEVRPAKLQPVVVTEYADTVEKAFRGALDKIKKTLATTFEKQKAF